MSFWPAGAARGRDGGQGLPGNDGSGFPGFFSPMDYGATGDGVADDSTPLDNCFNAAAAAGGIVIIDRPYGFKGKRKHYGGMGVWQITSRKILVVPTGVEAGLIALDSTAWYQYGDAADGSGSANDNPGSIWGLCVDGNNVAGSAHGGLFVCDASQSSIYDLMVVNSTGAGLYTGRSQNLNLHNIQIGSNVVGVLLEPLSLGQQGPGHIIFFGGHIHDNGTNIVVAAQGPTDFFPAHDIVFSKTLVESGRVAGQAIQCSAKILAGQVQFDDVNFTFGSQVGGSTGNPVVEDCLILIDNPQFTGYSTIVSIRGGSVGGGVNGVTDGIRIKQSGSANMLALDDVAWANVTNRVSNDGSVLGGGDALISSTGNSRDVTAGIKKIRAFNGATLLNGYRKTSLGYQFEMPTGTLNGVTIANGNVQNPVVIKHADETYSRMSIDWNGTIRHLNPSTGATAGSIVAGTTGYAISGENLVQIAGYATGSRPAASGSPRRAIYDTTLSRPLWSDGTTWREALPVTRGSATLDFASIAAGAEAELTITVTGAATGQAVMLGAPAAIEAGLSWNGYVSATNTVKVRLRNNTGSAIDPASATWTAQVFGT